MLRVKSSKLHATKCDELFIRECLHETQVNRFIKNVKKPE